MSARTQLVNGVTVFTTEAGKQVALFPRVPRTQYNFIVDLAKGEAFEALKRQLKRMSPDRVVAFRYDMQVIAAEQHKITCFEQVRAAKQAPAARLYKASLARLIAAANDALKEMSASSDNLFFNYDDLVARDAVAAAAQ